MNANELADYLQNKAEVELQPRLQESATMLRQQQAQIEALKVRLNPYQSITDTKIEPTVVSYTHPVDAINISKKCVDKTQNNRHEPVAFVTGAKEFQRVDVHTVLKVGTPLYTHPAELTDEEILISAQYNGIRASEILDEYVIDFARAILRKASEK